jgi:hypothetical protein
MGNVQTAKRQSLEGGSLFEEKAIRNPVRNHHPGTSQRFLSSGRVTGAKQMKSLAMWQRKKFHLCICQASQAITD